MDEKNKVDDIQDAVEKIEIPEMPKIEELLLLVPEYFSMVGAVGRREPISDTGEDGLLKDIEAYYKQKHEPLTKTEMKRVVRKGWGRSGRKVNEYVNRLLGEGLLEKKEGGYVPTFRSDYIAFEIRQILNYILHLRTYKTRSADAKKYIETICTKAEDMAIKHSFFLFSLKPDCKQYLPSNDVQPTVDGNLKSEFKDNKESLSDNANISKIDGKHWEIIDGKESYRIEDTGALLTIYGTPKILRRARDRHEKGVEKYRKKIEELLKGD